MITVGYSCNYIDNIKISLDKYNEYGFDYIVAPVIHPKCSEFIPFSEVFLDGKDRNKIVINIPKRDFRIQRNIRLLEKELNFAGHAGIQNIILECPEDHESIENMATIINRKLNPQSETNDHHSLAISIKLSMANIKMQTQELRKDPIYIDDDYEWKKWNHLRKIMQFHPNISIALEVNGELLDTDRLDRWLGEPIKFIILPTSVFLTNSSKFPVLSKVMQLFMGQINFKMASNFSIIIKGNNLHGHIKNYCQYIGHLQKTEIFSDKLQKFCQYYEDLLQYPLQPLKDDLDSSVYEVFETDIIKYQQYEKAIEQALMDIQKDVIIAMVVGAGRGPLVDKALRAAHSVDKFIRIYAVEKNPNAIITLEMLKDLKWGGYLGLSHGYVEIVSSDMRYWSAPERADLIISELLGSFGDNELSPECLDAHIIINI
ncbi:arginine n-methyltransferase 5-like protein [Dermatophagoides farinae]|uniref:Protein arginine N-methyltransferase 5 n=1 Tax=Dermatophagoides farinae TaxID=6954 RepID=A0A9D4P3P7_DERFA|nr:arginine n-methyltransferase 5-like protein [Dermatophagoides farinae]